MINLRILIYSNPLVVDKIAKKFQYWKDSGFIYTKQLVSNLPDYYRFYWLIPDKIKEYSWFYESNKNIEIVPYPYSTSIHQNRYNFSISTLNNYFTYAHDIDVILNNQPEVSANFRVWANNQRRELPLIFSFYHWIDCNESRKFAQELGGYGIRQMDGAINSDYIMFHNDYAYNLFKNESKSVFVDYDLDSKYRRFKPSSTLFNPVPFDLGISEDKKIILFNHRLNNTTRWKEVIDVLDSVHEQRNDFVLWITDDSKLKEMDNLRSREYIKIKNLRDGEYGFILKKSHFSICNHKGYSTWNMAVIDSFANGCLALIPNRDVYKDMFKNSIKNIGDKISHDGNLRDRIINLLNNSKQENDNMARQVMDLDPDLFVFNDGKSIKDKIENWILLSGSNHKKYDDVENFIRNRGGSLKKDWINRFWSFHVNSSFPAIRKRLLANSTIYDDTSSSMTFYKIKENKNDTNDCA